MNQTQFQESLTGYPSLLLYCMLLAAIGFSAEAGIIYILPTVAALSILFSEQRTAAYLWEMPHLSAASLADIKSIAIPPVLLTTLYSKIRKIAISF